VPTTPEPPTPETFVEAETHAQETAAVNEPLAITREVQPSPVETPAAAHDGAAAPDAASPDVLKDAKAS
jgi:sec-independent protein translocase protein TatB